MSSLLSLFLHLHHLPSHVALSLGVGAGPLFHRETRSLIRERGLLHVTARRHDSGHAEAGLRAYQAGSGPDPDAGHRLVPTRAKCHLPASGQGGSMLKSYNLMGGTRKLAML